MDPLRGASPPSWKIYRMYRRRVYCEQYYMVFGPSRILLTVSPIGCLVCTDQKFNLKKNPLTFDRIGFEVLVVVTVKSTLFWVITLCSLERVQRFGGTNRLLRQSRKVKQAAKMISAWRLFLLISCLPYSLTVNMEMICFSETSGIFRTI